MKENGTGINKETEQQRRERARERERVIESDKQWSAADGRIHHQWTIVSASASAAAIVTASASAALARYITVS